MSLFVRMKLDNEDIRSFVAKLDIQKRINLRDSLSGGRVEAFRSYASISSTDVNNGAIFYQDVQSLYPYILRSKVFPTDHPTVIPGTGVDMDRLDDYFGIILCRVLPPRGLHIPVLPFREGGKLLFPLCRTCAINSYQKKCECTLEQRAWVGCYTTPELAVARRQGYRVLKVFEILHWERHQLKVYDPHTKRGGLFTSYINTFIKIKCESSGYPASCSDTASRAKYIEEYYRTTGVKLDPSRIELNAGKRAVAKSLLNS